MKQWVNKFWQCTTCILHGGNFTHLSKLQYVVVLKMDMTMINTVAASNCTMHTGLHGTSHNFNFYVSNINIQRPSNIPDNIIINYIKI